MDREEDEEIHTRPVFGPKIRSKNSAAMSSPESLISSIGTTRKYAMFTSRYMMQADSRAIEAADLSVLTGFLTSYRIVRNAGICRRLVTGKTTYIHDIVHVL
jgi:hypothetical protein